jgi:hypothetical protein
MLENFVRKSTNYLSLFLVSGALSDVTNASNASEISHSKDIKSVEIGIIIGSTRPTRIGKQIAEWILKEISNTQGLTFKLIDLVDFNLPLLNEPVPAGQSDAYIRPSAELIF